MDTLSRQIRLVRGSLVIGKTTHRPGAIVSVAEDLFRWLQGKKSSTLKFEEVTPAGDHEDHEDEVPPSGAGDHEDHENTADEAESHTGEGEPVAGEDKVAEIAAALVPAAVSVAEVLAPSVLPLSCLDSKVSAALVAAGFDTLEKLAAAAVDDLVKVPGIGKVRAEAILSEVRK